MHILKGSIREQYFSQEGRKIQVEKKNRDILLIDHSSLMPTAGWYIEITLQCSGIREKFLLLHIILIMENDTLFVSKAKIQ